MAQPAARASCCIKLWKPLPHRYMPASEIPLHNHGSRERARSGPDAQYE